MTDADQPLRIWKFTFRLPSLRLAKAGAVAEFDATFTNGDVASYAILIDDDLDLRLDAPDRVALTSLSPATRNFIAYHHGKILDAALVAMSAGAKHLIAKEFTAARERARRAREARGARGSRN